MASFRVETDRRAEDLLVRLFGDFDLAAFEEVDGMLGSVQLNGSKSVIVDLRGLQFIDSTGIRALIRAHKRAETAGRQFCIVRGSEQIQRIFELTGLQDRLPFCDEA